MSQMELQDSTSLALNKSDNRRFLEHPTSTEYSTEIATDYGVNNEECACQDLQCEETVPYTESCPLVNRTISASKTDSCHIVTCTISIALAIPKGEEEELVISTEKAKKKPKRVLSSGLVEVPKVQGYYRIEYTLLPDDRQPTKVDLVMFGLAAKLYTENETKVLKPWQEGDQVWVGWSQSVQINVTKELLIKMASHKIMFKVWDTKDRVSAKARYDRPKAFRLPQGKPWDDPDHVGGIKNMVDMLRTVFEREKLRTRRSMKRHKDSIPADFKRVPELSCVKGERIPSTMDVPDKERVFSSMAVNAGGSVVQDMEQLTQNSGKAVDTVSELKFTRPGAVRNEQKDLLSKPAQKRSTLDQTLKASKQMSSSNVAPVRTGSVKDKGLVIHNKKQPTQKTIQESSAHMENIRKNGVASAELSLIYLLAGDMSLTDCLTICSGSVYEGFCNITLDQPLISKELQTELNPLVITILSASSLPSSPVPFSELEEKCLPVFCQYKFHNMPVHRTKGQEHSANIYFKDVNVILTGLLNRGELLEFLKGPPLEIEIHDRDRKAEKPSLRPAIFGTEPDDEKLADVALVSNKRTTYNTFREKTTPCDPHGIAKLNLSELLHGQKYLKLDLPIRCSPSSILLGNEKDKLDHPMPMGHYFEANSQLKVQIEIACSLNVEGGCTEVDCPFGRIVFLFGYEKTQILTKLRSQILQINASAFQLDSRSENAVERVLSGYKMSAEEREKKDFNVLTGFHMLDKHMHIIILEGLKDHAIKRLWETVPIKLDGSEVEQVTVLYDSSLSFSKRLYDSLNVGLSPIHIQEPLQTFMRQPLVYIRNMIPHSCFQAMSRISRLCHVKKLKDVAQNDLFPSVEMILSLSKEFGIVSENRKSVLMQEVCDSSDISHQHTSERTKEPINALNTEYIMWKQSQTKRHAKDFIQANIEEVKKISSTLQKPKPVVFMTELAGGQCAHNYSIQTINTTVQAWERLRREMAKEASCRFTYSQHYHSATVDPYDVDAERRASKARSQAAWQTYDGFTYPGFKSSIESNEHPKKPDEARSEELRKPWKENILHANLLEPTLNRCIWPWDQRYQELYIKPAKVFSPVPPVTIHLAGESLHQEQLEAAQAQYARWLRKVLPNKSSTGKGRVPEFGCHVKRANLDKLEDILKDKPMKYTLKKPGMVLKPIPVVSVVQHPQPSDKERMEREANIAFAPGPFQNHSLSWDLNTIPRHSSQYSEFHFRQFWRPRSFRYKRTALPLTDEERSIFTFKKPSAKTYRASVQTKHTGNIIESRTYDSVTLHVH